jgi:hypothetical protein
MNPRTFVIHAGEDREFVADLCTKLRSQGVDAWYSEWEILPGDSLIGVRISSFREKRTLSLVCCLIEAGNCTLSVQSSQRRART